jgi:hypothetical protein
LNEFDEILGEKAKCVKFDFSPENKHIKWNPTKGGNYVWKDWTSIGINVEPYHGEKIKIKLITRDCLQYGHAGYAYFTLDCIDAAITTTGCEEKMEMVAPEGFTYLWTKRSDPTFVWTEQILPVESSDFKSKRAIFLPEEARYDYLLNLPSEKNLGEAVD